MCWECDHPGATWHDYLAHLRELLQRHCWIVQGVQRERHRPPYAYTVGLTAHGQPELVATGLPYDRAVDLLNGVAEHVLHAAAPRAGEVIPLRGGPVIEIVRVAAPSVHLPVAAAINGPGFGALQLVYTDDRVTGRGTRASAAGAAASRYSARGTPAEEPDVPGVRSAAWARCISSAGRRHGGSPCALSCWPVSDRRTCSPWYGG